MKRSEYKGILFDQKNFKEISIVRSLNIGNYCLDDLYLYVFAENLWKKEKYSFSEALLKIFDEIITNSSDASIKSPETNKIDVFFDKGEIIIENNGPGISIYLDNDGKYSVEKVFTTEYFSSNYKDDKDSVTGGLNGIGAKMTNIYSKSFKVQTVCTYSNILYEQTFENNMDIINQPKIIPFEGKSFTRITFFPDYDKLCRLKNDVYSEDWIKNNKELMFKIIYRRCAELAVYSKASININNMYLTNNFDTFVKQHSKNYIVYNFEKLKIGICFFDPLIEESNKLVCSGFNHVSIFNGISFKEESNYITFLIKSLENFIKNHKDFSKHYPGGISSKKFPSKLFRNNITFISVFQYPRNKVNMKSNEKNKADINKEDLKIFEKNHTFPETFLKDFWEKQKKILEKSFIPKNEKTKIKYDKYIAAYSYPAEGLFIVEGDSASTLIKKIISYNKNLNKSDYGIFSVGGVPMNALKSSNFYNGKPLQSEKLRKNKVLQGLVNALGLDYEKELKPKYKKLILATDQDLDGIGKICSLIICFFELYFPYLIKNGFIQRLRTPIIRIYKKEEDCLKKEPALAEFYSETDYKNSKIKGVPLYYKGLAEHSEQEVKRMAENFLNNLVSIEHDNLGHTLINILYGKDTNIRKEKLREYLNKLSKEENSYEKELNIKLSEHCQKESIPSQLDNIFRTTPSIIDGLKPCSRKALTTIRGKDKIYKVAALSGKVISDMGYVHGDFPMSGVIFTATSNVIGMNVHPLFTAVSASIGSRVNGRENAAPRYSKIKYNELMDLYFPKEDDDILEYVVVENVVYEPKYYVPIVPRILIEHNSAPSTGWNHTFIGRDFKKIMEIIKININSYPTIFFPDLFGFPNSISENMRLIIDEKGRELCLGKVEEKRSENKIIITELPLQLWSKTVEKRCILSEKEKKNIKEKKRDKNEEKKDKNEEKIIEDIINSKLIENIKRVIDHSENNVHMIIEVKSDAWKIMDEKHSRKYMLPSEEALGLYTIFYRRLNFVYEEEFIEFKGLHEIFKLWFIKRKELYEKRIEKNNIRLKARLEVLENQYHFIKYNPSLTDNKNKSEVYELLTKNKVFWTNSENFIGYKKINNNFINTKEPCSPQKLKEKIYDFLSEENSEKNLNGWDYIRNLKKKEFEEKNQEKLLKEIKNLYEKLKENLNWKDLWQKDLEELEKYLNSC